MKIAVVSVFALFCAVGAFGEMPSYCNDYLVTSGSNYENSPLVLGDDWFSGNAPSAGSTNYIGVGMTVKGPTKDLLKTYPFKGDCFVLAGTMYMHAGSVSWKDLRLLDGAIYAWGSNSSLSGNLLVESGAQSPASIRAFFGNGMTFTDVNASVKGGADAALVLRRTTSGPAKVEMPDHYFFVKGSWDDYLGTVTVATNSALAFNSTDAAGNKTLGGKVVVERGGYWFGIMGFGYPSGVYTEVGSLEMQDGSFFWARPDSEGRATLVVVTNELTLGKVKFEFKKDWSTKAKADAPLPAYKYADGERCKESKFQLFKLTGAAAEKVPDLSGCMLPDHPNGFCGALPVDKRLVCEDNADGSKTIFMRYRTDFDWTMNTAKTTQKGWSECALNPANASYWVDGEMPSPDSVGVACATKAMEWRGPTNSDGFDFPGLTFVLDGALYLYAAYANVGNLVLMGGKSIWTHQGANEKHLRGKITVLSGAGASGIYNYIGTSLYIDARIAGDGELHLRQDANLKPQATYHLTADNSDFHGRLTSISKFANGDRGAYPDPSKGWYATIYLGGDHCLGGAYTGSKAFSALTLGSWTKLKIEPTLDTVTLAEAGRGILISNECLQVETLAGQKLSIKQQLTYNGNLLKLGEGELELAGPVRFIDGNSQSEPKPDCNRLIVSSGTVTVCATNAVDGVQIEVAEDARLAVDAACSSEGMGEYGFINTRWTTPFVSGLQNGEIPVEVKGLEEGKAASVAICTVSAETAENLKLRIIRAPRFACTPAKRVNADGTVTFCASFRPIGFGVIVR